MLVIGFPAAAFDTNCYVVAAASGEECVIVDPGVGVVDHLAEILAEHRLRPVSIMLTHGHIDHVASVTEVGAAGDLVAYIHADDRHRLIDPTATLAPALRAMLEAQLGGGLDWRQPPRVSLLTDDDTLTTAGLNLRVRHAPGHTEGSVMFVVPGAPAGVEATGTVFSGDVLFAGSIGRTDLAGGDPAAMARSLRDQVLTLPDDTLVLPGHGPATTIARERATNPHLAALLD